MYEIDNQKFGAFVAMLRKEKGYTQKELAERLFLSDKAVSKWERGLSLPDIALLEPLAQIIFYTKIRKTTRRWGTCMKSTIKSLEHL